MKERKKRSQTTTKEREKEETNHDEQPRVRILERFSDSSGERNEENGGDGVGDAVRRSESVRRVEGRTKRRDSQSRNDHDDQTESGKNLPEGQAREGSFDS